MKHFQNFLRDIGLDRATREDYRATIGEIKRSHASTFRQYHLMLFVFALVMMPFCAYFGFSAAAAVSESWPMGLALAALPLTIALAQIPSMNRMIWTQIRSAQGTDTGAIQPA